MSFNCWKMLLDQQTKQTNNQPTTTTIIYVKLSAKFWLGFLTIALERHANWQHSPPQPKQTRYKHKHVGLGLLWWIQFETAQKFTDRLFWNITSSFQLDVFNSATVITVHTHSLISTLSWWKLKSLNRSNAGKHTNVWSNFTILQRFRLLALVDIPRSQGRFTQVYIYIQLYSQQPAKLALLIYCRFIWRMSSMIVFFCSLYIMSSLSNFVAQFKKQTLNQHRHQIAWKGISDFSPNSFSYRVLTSSWGVSVLRFCGLVAMGGCHKGCRWGCSLVCMKGISDFLQFVSRLLCWCCFVSTSSTWNGSLR